MSKRILLLNYKTAVTISFRMKLNAPNMVADRLQQWCNMPKYQWPKDWPPCAKRVKIILNQYSNSHNLQQWSNLCQQANIVNSKTKSVQTQSHYHKISIGFQAKPQKTQEIQTRCDGISCVPVHQNFMYGLRRHTDNKKFVLTPTRPVQNNGWQVMLP